MEKEEIGNLSENRTFRKMRINCNLNQIVDVYYQLHYELFVEGKSFVVKVTLLILFAIHLMIKTVMK